ncbi:aminotransferase class I/II-fold pyridoxal phosphate-dependent enzyme [Geofilum rubicundum]|uniref:GDP-perosamine synthase n=1 Tax=Geofilum rubicundum JCM 15548 TaxID=1236989 RepID=A0A0E9M3B8_9BACT|nr:aminotransferase class I/II-fold pyridoxal phosphate-dependent enzyme [Geofilum rubicundum]GAO31665.1 4-keto-6-deoxy-N-Acetyl-D-hexosaminyl-aminotransferase [Geofilum rubicundum JCM 15548]
MENLRKRIYLACPHMGGNEINYVMEAFAQNWIAPVGPNIAKFEKAIAAYIGVKHVAALTSGSAALHLALVLLGVQRGDEVIASTLTFAATINPVVYMGAVPILVDSEPDSWNMSPDLLEEAIRDRIKKGKRPKAIIPVHIYGMPANMSRIMEIANRYEIPVIEDAAEALGSRYRDQPAGSFGKLGVLSFNGNKIITTSGGGALVSNDEKLIDKARFLSTQARDDAPWYQHSEIGYNYRLSNVLAGIGLGQMEVIDERVKRKRALFDFYRKQFYDFEGVEFLAEPDGAHYSNFWLTCLTVDPLKCGVTRDEIRLALEKENIESRPTWKPMHLQPVFSACPAYVDGTSDRLFEFGLCLPSGTGMTDEECQEVSRIMQSCFKVVF